ncbi:MAG TPA: porin [Candidatus Krumholzibacteria bacterium]|nr:porin [Candidatus Krumholzibacteria bacterium]
MALGLIGSLLLADAASAQDSTKADSPLDETIEAGEAQSSEPRRKLVHWNEYEGPYFTIRLGAGFLYEGAAYSQDDASQQQFDLEPDTKVRDTRFLLRGRFKTKRPISWSAGIMYDGATDDWLFRETGVMVAVPELWGHFFIGRTKEGFSLNKVMSGYAGWTMERSSMSDATIPILGDGVKWLGYVPKRHLIWNLGYYLDSYNARQAFSTYDNQVVARVAWLPILSEDDRTLLHVGVNGRYGNVDEDLLQIRARPEANPAPYFVDTGSFAARHTSMAGWEAYYRSGPWMFGNEYWFQKVESETAGDPVFQGGDVVATWILTGETRAYNTVGGFFKSVSPARTLFEGGPGAVEAVLRFSYIDLDGGSLRGGKFWRLTPMVNWHMSDHVRLELTYGYGKLDRFDVRGGTHFFQSRLQLTM